MRGSYSENSFTKKQLVRFLCLLWFLDLWTAWFSIMGIKFKKRSQENVSLILTNSSHQTVAHHHPIKKFVSRPLIWDKSLGKPVYWTIFLEMFRSHCQHLPPSEICLVVSWTKCLMYFTIFCPYLPQKRFVSWAKETNFLVGSWMYIVDQLHPITKYVSWSHELMSHGTLSCDDLVINCTYCYYLNLLCPRSNYTQSLFIGVRDAFKKKTVKFETLAQIS